ncbi:Rx, N-terminal [Dillenia turbinata]|uniref:Rx, N-terminal n=1 Tax=Dillenia turbinata TaxID=194707 RepID=A0AAN8VF38_9MAGN
MPFVVEAIVGAAIEPLINKLMSSELLNIFHRDQLLKAQNKWVEKLGFLRALLTDAEEKKVTNEAAKIWLGQLRDLALPAQQETKKASHNFLVHVLEASAAKLKEKERVCRLKLHCGQDFEGDSRNDASEFQVLGLLTPHAGSLKELEIWSYVLLPNVEELMVFDCSELERLSNGLHMLASQGVVYLELHKVVYLELPLMLKILDIQECEALRCVTEGGTRDPRLPKATALARDRHPEPHLSEGTADRQSPKATAFARPPELHHSRGSTYLLLRLVSDRPPSHALETGDQWMSTARP